MSISEAERNEIFESVKTHHGERVASNLMSMLPPVGWADVATKSDLHTAEVALRSDLHTAEVALRSDLHTVEAAIRTDLAAVETRLDRRINDLERSIDRRFGDVEGRFGEIDRRFGEVDQRFGEIDQRFTRLEATLATSLADVRAEMHQSVRNQTWALVAWTTGLAGLIIAVG